MTLRVVAYNVRYAGLDEGSIAWERRRDRVADVLAGLEPDVIALQECWHGQLDDLRARTPHEWVAFPDENGSHTPVGFDPERFERVDATAFGIAPDGELGVVAWDAAFPRVATRVTLRDRETQATFPVVSLHLDHRGSEARLEGARLVRDRLPDGPAVVAGDCNCTPDAPPYAAFTESLSDSRRAAGETVGPRATYVGFGGRAHDEDSPADRRRLDYVFTRGFETRRYAVHAGGADGDDEPAGRPSDHRPVAADLAATD
ncbi:endonuclease/exonuclease/phosphatase family protein [Halobaculum sp. MBLA0143]|uniref:endonuclease/exonuclease/phosphatase family protein n=1 Tax=Halobaculum sp. MBLA0143 TaxID=3079933 RepID=UPI00352394F6